MSNVTVRILPPKSNLEKGFYLLFTTGDTYSDKKYEFIIDERGLEILKKNKIKFKVIRRWM